MNVVVTGAAGHFGSYLTCRLLEQGYTVVGLDALLYGAQGLAPVWSHPRFRFLQQDVRQGIPRRVVAVDAIVHLAALVGPICEQQSQLAWETNCEATAVLCRWAQRRSVRLIFASTCSNYGRCEGLATETTPLNPLGTYAKTKVAAERLVSESRDAVTLRFATLAGVSPRPRLDTLLNQLTVEGMTHGLIELREPTARRPFTHLWDAAHAVRLVLEQRVLSHHCFNVVGFNTSIAALGRTVRRATGCAIRETALTEDRRDYAVSGARLERTLGFHPLRSLAACVEDVRSGLVTGVVQPSELSHNVKGWGRAAADVSAATVS